jgi:MinD-like ATPase involved in chromosome partitioning or flagellar assembly
MDIQAAQKKVKTLDREKSYLQNKIINEYQKDNPDTDKIEEWRKEQDNLAIKTINIINSIRSHVNNE